MSFQLGRILTGKSFTSKGEKRYALFVWQIMVVGLFAVLIFFMQRYARVMEELSQKKYVVFEVGRDGQVKMREAADYQFGPLPVEVEGRAIDTLRWIVGAGSNNIDTAFTEAARGMTQDMQRQFEAERGEAFIEKVKKLNIYRIVSEIDARPLKVEDLSVSERQNTRPSKYDVVVFGTVNTYRRGSNEWIDESKFAVHVQMQPQELRTKENMSALLINNMRDLDANQAMNYGAAEGTAESGKSNKETQKSQSAEASATEAITTDETETDEESQ